MWQRFFLVRESLQRRSLCLSVSFLLYVYDGVLDLGFSRGLIYVCLCVVCVCVCVGVCLSLIQR